MALAFGGFGGLGSGFGSNPTPGITIPTPTIPALPNFGDIGMVLNAPLRTAGDAAKAVANTASGGVLGAVTSFLGLDVLRLVLLIIGLICIVGAIYLFKPTQDIVAVPARAARDAVVAGAVA